MPDRHTVLRSMHDVGLAAWFGGSLMGAVGLNGGAAAAKEPSERLRVSSAGWGRWTPVQLAAIAVHGVGGIGLIVVNRGRLAVQGEARTNTVVKTLVTVLAGAASVVAGLAGGVIAKHAGEGAQGTTEPGSGSSDALAKAQRVERVTQWVIPASTAALLVLGAQQGEQQRASAGLLRSAATGVRRVVSR